MVSKKYTSWFVTGIFFFHLHSALPKHFPAVFSSCGIVADTDCGWNDDDEDDGDDGVAAGGAGGGRDGSPCAGEHWLEIEGIRCTWFPNT